MKILHSVLPGAALVAALAMGAMGSAQAGNVYWSAGIAQPGLQVGVSSFPAAPMAMPPVVIAPRPVAYYAPPVVVPRAPVYYGYGYGRPGWVGHERWERHEGWGGREGWHHHEGRR